MRGERSDLCDTDWTRIGHIQYFPGVGSHGVEVVRGGFIEPVEEVSVHVEGGPDRGVAEALSDHFRMLIRRDKESDMAVSKVMKAARLTH